MCGGTHGRVVAGEAERAQKRGIGAIMREEEALGEPHVHARTHLGEALERGGARPRDRARVAGGRDVAEAETAIIVRGADQAIEVDFARGHGTA